MYSMFGDSHKTHLCNKISAKKKVSGDCTRKLKVVNLININPKARMRKVTKITYESDFLK